MYKNKSDLKANDSTNNINILSNINAIDHQNENLNIQNKNAYLQLKLNNISNDIINFKKENNFIEDKINDQIELLSNKILLDDVENNYTKK